MSAAQPLPPEARAALDLAPCGLLRLNAGGVILRANRTFCSWIGYTEDDLVGRVRLQDLLTVGGRIFHQTHWTPLLQMQGSVSEVKLEVMRRGGEPVPMVLNAVRRPQACGYVDDLAVFVARDRDAYERELVQSRKKLQTLVAESTRLQEESRDRAQFAEQMMGIVSHDLRNPLAAIQLGAEALKRLERPADRARVMERILRAVDRAQRLISDLMDFTQARLGKGLPLSIEPVNLRQVVAETVEELTQAYPGRLLRHEHTGEDRCHCDADRLAQLVGNLVSNAMAYGLPQGPVTVNSRVSEHAFEISVHNFGTPIAPEQQSAIFRPMTRGVGGRSAVRSVGLGLYIVSEIARAHGGRVSVESSAAAGTTFRAAFPRQPA